MSDARSTVEIAIQAGASILGFVVFYLIGRIDGRSQERIAEQAAYFDRLARLAREEKQLQDERLVVERLRVQVDDAERRRLRGEGRERAG